jgi:hypothetical protein
MRDGFGIDPTGSVTMSEQTQTVIVYRDSIIRAAYAQYCEANGGTHALVLDDKTNMLSYSPGGNYYDGDKISASEIMIVHFDDDVDSPFEAVEYTEAATDTVEFQGETYNLEIIND